MNLLYENDKRGAYPRSWYAATAEPLDSFAPLRGQQTADLCIIGGGYTGLSAAFHAAEAGLDVVILEAQRVGFGASGRNGGQVGTGFNKTQRHLEKLMGKDVAHQLWDMSLAAKNLTVDLCEKHAPDANFKEGVAHADWHMRDVADTHAEAQHLAETYGYDQIDLLEKDAMRDLIGSPVYHGGSLDRGAGHLHPLHFALGLARACEAAGVRLHELSRVHNIKHGSRVKVQTDQGQVTAGRVIIATNGYDTGLSRKTAARVMPLNNFIIATEPLGDKAREVLKRDIAVADSKFVVNYFRLSEDNRLLFGGGESYGYKFPADITAVVRKPMAQVFPQLADAQIDYAWGGTLAITMSRLPHVAHPAPNVRSAAGYSGHGVALATFAGKLMAEATTADASGLTLLEKLPTPAFPGGGALRSPLLTLAMTWYSTRDRLGL